MPIRAPLKSKNDGAEFSSQIEVAPLSTRAHNSAGGSHGHRVQRELLPALDPSLGPAAQPTRLAAGPSALPHPLDYE